MKNMIFAAVAALVLSSGAHAESVPAGCKLEFHVKIDSILFLSKGGGRGLVTCSDAQGFVTAQSRVNIDIDGIGLGLGTFELQGVSGSVGILDPSQLTGVFAVAEANVGFGAAVGASLGFHGQDNGLSFTGNVNAGRGIGVYLNGTRWIITLAE